MIMDKLDIQLAIEVLENGTYEGALFDVEYYRHGGILYAIEFGDVQVKGGNLLENVIVGIKEEDEICQ